MSYLIQKPGLHDLDAIMSLWREQFEYHHDLDPVYYVRVTDVFSARMLAYVKTSIEEDKPHMLVARDDKKLIGFITYAEASSSYFDSNIEKFGQVFELFTDSAYRRKGVGSLLLQAVEHFFREKGLTHMMLESSAKNPRAIDFYGSHGYTPRIVQHFKSINK